MLRRFADRGGRRAVITGTCAEYAWGEAPLTEDAPLAPRSAYAQSKHALSAAVEQIARDTGLSTVWARPFFLYGPGDHPERFVPSTIAALSAGRSPQVAEPDARRDYVHVDDVAAALATLIDAPLDGPVNLGSGSAIAIRDLVRIVARAVGRPELGQVAEPVQAPDVPIVLADISRLRDATGFEPRPLEDGIAQTVAAHGAR
jgi:nucleoside-diphosphate-sugar epimerase